MIRDTAWTYYVIITSELHVNYVYELNLYLVSTHTKPAACDEVVIWNGASQTLAISSC